MKAHARAVVIGGGVVGCSVLYHLAKLGWTDVVLVERSELTSGSTWHAAGGMHTINGDPNLAKLQKYTIALCSEIEALSEQATGLHITGGVMLAATRERFEWLKGLAAKGRYLDIEAEIVTPEEAHEIMPLLDPACFVGGMRTVVDGHLDPSGVTHAYAKSARRLGAEIELRTKVEALSRGDDGLWRVATDHGEIRAEHVVNAAGLWAREVGRMVGLELPVLAMEHMYLVTDDLPEVAEINRTTGKEVVHAIDFDGELYLRQEQGGMLMGTYEKACVPWSVDTTPWDFGHELLPEDIDRIAPSLEVGFRHFPALQNAGIKRILNGPFTFAPDGNPLVGPVRGHDGFWVACGVMAGFSQGGGVGLALANWMIDGDPGVDAFAMDVARYGAWATRAYTHDKVKENYSRRFSIRYPNEELPAARPLRTTPIHDRLCEAGAQFGDAWGLEVPLWFAPPGVEDVFSWHRSVDFEHVGAECRAVREGVGLSDISGFAKYLVAGAGARDWLDRVLAGRVPKAGPHRARAHAQGGRQADRRFHARQSRAARLLHRRFRPGRGVPSALVPPAPAGRRIGRAAGAGNRLVRPLDRRAGIARGAPVGHRRRRVGRGVQVHGHPRDRSRHGPGGGRTHHLHRRSRLRDLVRPGLPALPVRPADRGRQAARHAPVRVAGAQRAQAGEGVRHLGAGLPPALRAARGRARPLRRLPQGGGFRRQGGGPCASARWAAACAGWCSRWMRPPPTCSATSRCGTRARCAAG